MVSLERDLIPFKQALNQLDQNGEKIRFWFRDDDASDITPGLLRLLELTQRFNIPVLLAVVPGIATSDLALTLSRFDHVKVAIHGWQHKNHADAGQKSQELGPHRPLATVTDELAQSMRLLHEMFNGQAAPILVPPWNRITSAIVQKLPDLGFEALSTFGTNDFTQSAAPLKQLNPQIDIIDWRGARTCRQPIWLARELTRLTQQSALDHSPIGILSHHLVHDEMAWRFLEAMFEITADHGAATWCDVPHLLSSPDKAATGGLEDFGPGVVKPDAEAG